MSETGKNSINLEPERALFEGQLQGLVVSLYENERPPQGLCGLLDWYFHGAISRCIRKGAITGTEGECVYFPFSKNGATYHIFLAGSGQCSEPGQRNPVSASTLHTLQKNLASLKLSKVGISRADFGQVTPDFLSRHLKGVPLWITP